MSDDQQRDFIQNVRRALGKPLHGGPEPQLFHIPPADLDERLEGCRSRTHGDRRLLIEELSGRARDVQMRFYVVQDAAAAGAAIAGLVSASNPEWGDEKRVVAWDHPLIEAMELEKHLAAHQVPVVATRLAGDQDRPGERARLRREVEAAYIGVTTADFVVAHTATMVMKSRPRQLRSVSLVPSIHVCVVREDQLVADLEELYMRLQWDAPSNEEGLTNCMTFISAPSKTGDIELVMVNGAHGPREVHLIVISD